MKKKILLPALLLLTCITYGQTQIKKSAVSTGGGSATTGTVTVISAIGEVAVQEQSQGNIHISEGFIGPDIAIALGIQDYGILQGISVFPNPVQDNLSLQMQNTGNYEIFLYDINGKQLLHKQITAENQAVYNLANYAPATYLLIVIDRKNHLSKQFKIIKN